MISFKLLADSSRYLVLPILEYGYFLQFDEEPPSVKLKNNNSALEHTKSRAANTYVHVLYT
jgi:hypothetical protein